MYQDETVSVDRCSGHLVILNILSQAVQDYNAHMGGVDDTDTTFRSCRNLSLCKILMKVCQTVKDLTCHSCVMKSCDGATLEQLIVAMVEPLLPTALFKLWSDFISELNLPTLADLLKFLKRHSQAVEAIVPSSQS